MGPSYRRLLCLYLMTAASVIIVPLISRAQDDPILIWRVGSPWNGDTPATTIPLTLRDAAQHRGFLLAVEAFPATGFAARFSEAVARNASPDIIVFDNFGVMNGITTPRGRFDGIAETVTRKAQLIRVTGAFDELLGPRRGWTYLFSPSRHHRDAYALALALDRCPDGSSGATLNGELGETVSRAGAAYLAGDASGVQAYADPDRLSNVVESRVLLKVNTVRVCGAWGNDKLAIVSVDGNYEGDTAIGQAPAVLVLRKPATHWKLLVAARDPLSTGAFVKGTPAMAALLSRNTDARDLPIPAVLVGPPTGEYPVPSKGERFGDFTWRSSSSADMVFEVAEFVYRDEARLIFKTPQPSALVRLSAGDLLSGASWTWRIWSVSRTGDVVFSETRSFVH